MARKKTKDDNYNISDKNKIINIVDAHPIYRQKIIKCEL